MMSNPIFLETMAKERRLFFVEEAKRARLRKMARDVQSKPGGNTIEMLADLLINCGEYLKRKYGSKVCLTVNSTECLSKRAV